MPPPPLPPSEPQQPESTNREDRKKKAEELFSKRRLGEGELNINEDKLAQALREEKKRKGRVEEDDDRHGKRKKGGAGTGSNIEVTEEELGALFSFVIPFGFNADWKFRGIPDEPADDRGSYGKLCGHGGLIGFPYKFPLFSCTRLCTYILVYYLIVY